MARFGPRIATGERKPLGTLSPQWSSTPQPEYEHSVNNTCVAKGKAWEIVFQQWTKSLAPGEGWPVGRYGIAAAWVEEM